MFAFSVDDILNNTRVDVYYEDKKIKTKIYVNGNEVKTNKKDFYYVEKLYNLLFNPKAKKIETFKKNNVVYYKDNIVNLLHKTISGNEDFNWFFENNGYSDLLYDELNDKSIKNKSNSTKRIVATIACSLILAITVNIPLLTEIFKVLEQRKKEYKQYPFQVEIVDEINKEYGYPYDFVENESIIDEVLNKDKYETIDMEIKDIIKNNSE